MSDDDDLWLEDDDYDDDPCDHDDHDTDILSGRATCYRCGESWWMSAAELKREIGLLAQVYECVAADPSRRRPMTKVDAAPMITAAMEE